MSVAHRTYARALFEAAKENGRLAQVREELGDFVAAVEEVPELDAMLRNPQLDPRAKAQALEDVLGGADKLVRNFLLLTVEKNRAGQLREIHREFERLMAAEERRLTVEVTTAYELSDDEARQIVGQIERASGRPVDATRSVDPNLIGGIILQAGSLRLDASIRSRLERLRRDLTTTR
ncbi:MAG: ATP synthase F1 subunit delta [Gaiellaceae bacterium]